MSEDKKNDNTPSPDDPTLDPEETATSPISSSDNLIGTKIGSFTIKRIIGSGGMGIVYEAMQEKPRRRIALKMMKRGITSRSATRRFEFESQTLARLQHPGIAQVFEVGTHDDGTGGVPYFVMEYIANAKTLTEFANENNLGTHERLALFNKVCDAVQHGHLKGIVHRDLKPGNILIDSRGQPKIIDFGVARSTDSDMAVTTLQTDVGQLIGTLQYMSPEQCAADPSDIDTRSDIYALGVVLYELLTDKPPYNLQQVALHEAVRVIREEEPTKLSTVAQHLRGDVEKIAMKALEKHRDQRYQSAAALSDDVNHYLNEEPIAARGPTIGYLLQKHLAQHRIGFGLLVILFAILLGSYVWLTNMSQITSLSKSGASESEIRWITIIARQVQLERLVSERTAPLLNLPHDLESIRSNADVLAAYKTEKRLRAKTEYMETPDGLNDLNLLSAFQVFSLMFPKQTLDPASKLRGQEYVDKFNQFDEAQWIQGIQNMHWGLNLNLAWSPRVNTEASMYQINLDPTFTRTADGLEKQGQVGEVDSLNPTASTQEDFWLDVLDANEAAVSSWVALHEFGVPIFYKGMEKWNSKLNGSLPKSELPDSLKDLQEVRGLTVFDEFRTSWDPETLGSNEWGNRAYYSTAVSFAGFFMGFIGILFGLYMGLGIKAAKPVLQVLCVPLTFALPLYLLFAAFNIFGIGPIAGIYPVTFSFLLFIACVLFLRATSQTPYTISLFRCLYWSMLLSFGVTFLVPSSISNNIQWKIISLTTIALSIAAVVWDYRTTSERRVAGIGFVFWPIIAILGVVSVTVFCISFLKSIEASELLQLAFAETLIGIIPFGYIILLIEKHRLAQTLPWGITTKQLTPRLIVLKFLLVVCIVAPLISGDWGSNRSELWVNGLFTTLVIFLICQIVSIRRFLDTEQRQPSNSKVITDGPAFDVFLESVGEKKVRVIKAIRKLSGFGIKKTKDLIDKAPVLLKENCTADEANDIKEKLENVGATVSLKQP